MSESLVIRLGTNKQQPVAWLVWSGQEQEIIASGTLPSADALGELQERAGGRPVVTLVPGSDSDLPARHPAGSLQPPVGGGPPLSAGGAESPPMWTSSIWWCWPTKGNRST